MSIRIILADDHKIIRDGLRSLLEQEEDIEVVAQAKTGHEAVELVAKFLPHVVIMDIAMPDMNGIEATRHITNSFENVKIIALSMHSDRKFVIEMLKAGASGYLLKNCAFEELANAIRTVTAGKTYLSPSITDVVVDNYVRGSGDNEPSVFSVLTRRERGRLTFLTHFA